MIYINGKDENSFVNIDNGLDIVVFAPSFCWFKTLEIPTKNINKAKKIADHMLADRPSQYTDLLLQKNDEQFKVYCYDKQEIEDIFKKLNKPNIKVYFAYELTDNLLYLIDDNSFVDFLKSLKDIKPKPILKLNPNRNKNSNILIATNIFLFASIVLYSLTQYSMISKIEQKINNIKDDGKSGYEIKSLIKTYKSKEKKSNKLKKSLSDILKKEKNLALIEYKKGKFYTETNKGKN